MAEATSPGGSRGTAAPAAAPAGDQRTMSRIIAASLIGTTVEYYDFAVYGTASALVLASAFFPSGNPTLSTLASFLSFGAAFLARPVGVVLFGTIGDRLGRKQALFFSLMLMGISTVGVGLLPTYAAAGLLAPVLLIALRLLQGVALGGEWAGAALLAGEHAPPGRRAWYASVPQVGALLGFLLSSAVILPTINIVGMDGFTDWAWRLPFLLSTVLIVVGLWVRTQVSESPLFRKPTADRPAPRFPLGTLLKESPGTVVLGIGAAAGGGAVYYLTTVYSLSYAPSALGISSNTMVAAACAGAAVAAVVSVPAAGLTERVGRRPVILTGIIGCALWAWPMYGSLSTRNGLVIAGAYIVGLTFFTLIFSPMGAFLPELFPTRLRYTGAAATFMVAITLGGGFAPSIATWLNSYWSSPLVLSFYACTLCLVSLGCVLALPETRGKEFDV